MLIISVIIATFIHYRPRLSIRYVCKALGLTEDAAVNGLIDRMNGLIAYSRERGRMVRPMAETNRRKDAEAIIREFPDLAAADVAACLHYARDLADFDAAA